MPFTNSGSASGMTTTLPAISRTIRAAALATSARPASASLGNSGEPAAKPSSSNPSSYPGSSGSTPAIANATAGASTKLAPRARRTHTGRRSGAMISALRAASPIDSMLDTTKTTTAPFTSNCSASMALALVQSGEHSYPSRLGTAVDAV